MAYTEQKLVLASFQRARQRSPTPSGKIGN